MIQVGLVGLGCMGSAHFHKYQALMADGLPIKLVAICDIDEKKLQAGSGTKGNIEIGGASMAFDLTPYTLYNDMMEMIRNESLDYVDLCLPTSLHGPMSITAMEAGVHVFCEKPMAISSDMCRQMIETAKKTGKKLMIGQTLRYWDVYEYAKQCIDNNTYGKCISAYFFRGGATPAWSWNNWLLHKEMSGGCLLDQHIHDVDAINWLFGTPAAVTTSAVVVNAGSGYDAVSTNYIYEDGKVVNAQDDWTINGDGFNFKMLYRINFENGALVYENNELLVCPVGGKAFNAELSQEDAYYKELRLFNELLRGEIDFDYIALLESHRNTILIAEAEQQSADLQAEKVMVQQ